jgi:formate-dependent nitrite reductase membrane component NrfD
LITSDHNTNSTPRYSAQIEDAHVGTLSTDEMMLSIAQVDQSANSVAGDGLLLVSIYLVVFSLLVIVILESIEIHYLKHLFSPRRAYRRRA